MMDPMPGGAEGEYGEEGRDEREVDVDVDVDVDIMVRGLEMSRDREDEASIPLGREPRLDPFDSLRRKVAMRPFPLRLDLAASVASARGDASCSFPAPSWCLG